MIDVLFESPALDLYTTASNNRLKGFYRESDFRRFDAWGRGDGERTSISR